VDLLRAVALGESMDIGREVVVVGGGNVRTMWPAQCSARSPTTRRAPRRDCPALLASSWFRSKAWRRCRPTRIEILEGDEEGIERWNGWGPVEIERDAGGAVTGAIFRKCLRVYDENRRFAPLFDDAQRQVFTCDTVLLAVGQAPLLRFLEDGGQDVEMFRPGWPKVDSGTLATTAEGVFVAGDLAHARAW